MRRLLPWAPAALIAGVLLLPALGQAQDCSGGRVVGPETAGRCCWPGQSWSEEDARCTGAPRCPAGLAGSGDTCVPSAAPSPESGSLFEPVSPELSPPPPAAAPAQQALTWPLVSSDLGHGVVNPREVRRNAGHGLIVTGITLLAAGYVVAGIAGGLDQAFDSCGYGGCDSWPLAFVPIVGGVLAGIVHFNGYRDSTLFGLGVGIPAAVVQSVGLILLIAGLVSHDEELVPAMYAGQARIQILPYAGSTGAGLSMTVEL